MLDGAVIDRIAAGEVVERPASVVKELVENALDAGASRIDVRIEAGGRRLIEVEDDGHGMTSDDAMLAFRQHATSKIATVEDLDDIRTLGFRGEALASIAAVARVEMHTGTGEGAGAEIRVEEGETPHLRPSAGPRGTRVRVHELFDNIPARRKHLRTDSTEAGHVAAVVEDFALLRPDVGLTLSVNGRERLVAPPVGALEERIHQVLGSTVAECWVPVEGSGEIRVDGGVTSPEHTRSNRRHIHLFVNGRVISDGRLSHAVVAGFDSLLDHRRFPVAALFLTLDPAEVDVNVHPRKAEVRFVEPGRVFAALRRGVATALASQLLPPRAWPLAPTTDGVVRDAAGGAWTVPTGALGAPSLPLRDWVSVGHPAIGTELREGQVAAPITGTTGAVQPLAQYANTYILAVDDGGLLIIDQHVAHERVLYEQVLEQRSRRRVAVQGLLVPETVELTAFEVAAAEQHQELLATFGFEIEPFGGRTWTLRTVPEVLGARRGAPTLRALLASLADERGGEAAEHIQNQVAASIACHAAVKANQPLTREVMASLISQLGECESPTRCPHGRPIMLRLDHRTIERQLGRH